MHFLGKNLRYLRKQFDETQVGLAQIMGKGQTTIGNWENGVSEPNLDELLVISNYFDTPIDVLLKVDLAQTNWRAEKKTGYDLEKKEETMVKEEDANLSYVLHALQRMQEEIDRINMKINKKGP
jgi:transcriptional regulator with XRE-family HTH domain